MIDGVVKSVTWYEIRRMHADENTTKSSVVSYIFDVNLAHKIVADHCSNPDCNDKWYIVPHTVMFDDHKYSNKCNGQYGTT